MNFWPLKTASSKKFVAWFGKIQQEEGISKTEKELKNDIEMSNEQNRAVPDIRYSPRTEIAKEK